VLAFSPDCKTLAVGGGAHNLYLFDVATSKDALPRAGHHHAVVSVAFSPDGKTLASRGGDQTVRLWDLSANKELRQWPIGGRTYTDQLIDNFPYPERTLAFSPDGQLLAASAGPDDGGKNRGGVFLWDVASGRLREEFRGTPEGHFPPRFTPDGQALLVPTRDGPKLCSPQTGKVLGPMPATTGWLLAFSPDGHTSVGRARGARGDVLLEDWRTGVLLSSFPAWQTQLNLLEFSPCGHLVAAAGIDDDGKGRQTRGIRLHETATGTLWRSLAARGRADSTGTVGCFAFSPDHRLFAAVFMPNYRSGPRHGLDVVLFNVGGVAREPTVAWHRALERGLC
jgi:WD40 repeat protein